MFPEGSGIDAQVTFVFPQGIAFLNSRSGQFYQPITLLWLGSILKLSTGLKRAVISCSFHLHLTSQNTLASRYRNISRNGKLSLYILYQRSNFTSRSTAMRWLQHVATPALSDSYHKGPVWGCSPIRKGGCLALPDLWWQIYREFPSYRWEHKTQDRWLWPSGIIWDIVPTTINSECLNFRKLGNRYHHFVVSYSKRFLIIWLAVAYVAIYIITSVWCIFSNCYFVLRMLQHKLSKVSVSLLFDAFLIIWLGVAYVARYIVKSSTSSFFFHFCLMHC